MAIWIFGKLDRESLFFFIWLKLSNILQQMYGKIYEHWGPKEG